MIEQIQRIDDTVLDFIYLHARSDMLDLIMPVFSLLGNLGAVWVITGLILICGKKHKVAGAVLLSALVIGAVAGDLVIKNLVTRPRPFIIHQDIDLLIPVLHGHSFPSGHTVSSFASAFALFIVNPFAGICGIVLACLISFSRLYLYVHYLSDVIAGLIIGILSCLVSKKTVLIVYRRIKTKDNGTDRQL